MFDTDLLRGAMIGAHGDLLCEYLESKKTETFNNILRADKDMLPELRARAQVFNELLRIREGFKNAR